MQARPATAETLPAPLPLPDDASARDANYSELATLLDLWMSDAHEGEPDWDLEDLSRTRLPVQAGAR